MDNDSNESGALQLDGHRVNAVRYEVSRADDPDSPVRLRFMNGRHLVAKIEVDRAELGALLGAANQATIEAEVTRQVRAAGGPAIGDPIRGVLRGATLRHADVNLPAAQPEAANEISSAAAERDQGADPPAPDACASDSPPEHPSGFDRAEGAAQPGPAVPPWVAAKFIKVRNRYYFADRTLAFVDRGNKLRAHTHNREVVRSLLAIAKARNWAAVKVSGSDEFKRLVWQEGEASGIQVQGFNPSEVDRAAQARASAQVPHPAAQADAGRNSAPAQAAGPSGPVPSEQGPAFERISGRLVASGADHYRFDRRNTLSYYVKLQTPHGERVFWGSDLERALIESQTRVQIGDRVELERRGSVPVTVMVPRRDADGNLVGEERQTRRRTTWVLEKPSFFENRQRNADALRSGMSAARDLARGHPDLVHAVVSLWLAEQFATRMIERPDDRERVVALVRERLARALEQGDDIVAPRLHPRPAREVPHMQRDARDARTRVRARAPTRTVQAARNPGEDAAARAQG